MLFLLSLSGCTAKLAYKNLDWIAYWYISDYIDFTDSQEKKFDQELATWLGWHKKEELPLYINHLNELSNDISDQKLSFDRLTYHQQKFLAHWLRLKTKIVPGLVSIAPLLSKSQIAKLFEKIDQQNQELSEEQAKLLKKSVQQQKNISIKKRSKSLKRWLGKITDEQEKLIDNNYGQYHANYELWLAYRVRYQIAVSALFDQPDRGEKFQSALSELLMHPEVFKGKVLTQRNDENAFKFKTFLLSLEATFSDKQRQYMVEEIGDFSEDITDIIY
jgi:hypothetical protein